MKKQRKHFDCDIQIKRTLIENCERVEKVVGIANVCGVAYYDGDYDYDIEEIRFKFPTEKETGLGRFTAKDARDNS